MRDFTDRTAQLEQRRAELLERMHSLDAELDSHGDPDWEENAIEHEQDGSHGGSGPLCASRNPHD